MASLIKYEMDLDTKVHQIQKVKEFIDFEELQ